MGTAKEETISTNDVPFSFTEDWVAGSRLEDLDLGPSIDESLSRAVDLQRRISTRELFALDDSSDNPDVLHALCRLLMEQCVDIPALTLRDARIAREALDGHRWESDELSEREGILCSLTLVCWRASRLLNLTREVQRLWSDYRQYFRLSLDWDVIHQEWNAVDHWRRLQPTELAGLGSETIFRMLLQLGEDLESDPQSIRLKALALYDCLSESAILPADLHSFFQGDAARIIGCALRVTGQHRDANDWLDKAEAHVRAGVNPDPQLARILFARLAASYATSQLEPVLRVAPALDKTFAGLGMEEDRVKCGILWAASLKIAGQPERALDLLEGIRRSSPTISSQLLGWVLAEIGDIHAICGNYERGVEALQIAAHLLRRERQFTGLAHVNSMIGGICRSGGLLQEAVRIFAASVEDFRRLGMTTSAAYTRLLLAETYLAMQLPRDAESEILKALPVLEDEGIVPDALVALSILREAVRRQKLEPQMLRELRERLRPSSQ